MNNADIETLYKENSDISHVNGLRGVWLAGYVAGAGNTLNNNGKDDTDVSITQSAPTVRPRLKRLITR